MAGKAWSLGYGSFVEIVPFRQTQGGQTDDPHLEASSFFDLMTSLRGQAFDGSLYPFDRALRDGSISQMRDMGHPAHVDPPYLLVGHSAGGILIRRFTRSFPGRVAGLVLIDSAHEEQVWRFQAIDPRSVQGPPADPALIKRGGGLAPGELLDWHYDKPLIVLEHGKPLTFQGSLAVHAAEFNAAVDAMARDLAERSPRGQLRIAIRSGHEIMLDDPPVVVEAIRDAWEETMAEPHIGDKPFQSQK